VDGACQLHKLLCLVLSVIVGSGSNLSTSDSIATSYYSNIS
jgi:hypothetical protein